MNIDIYTFALVLGIIALIQFLIFLIEYNIHKTYNGPGWWVLWCATAILGYIFMQTRQIPAMEKISILCQNTFLILSSSFLYIGLMRFLGRRERLKVLIIISITYFLLLCYFIYFEDDIRIRTYLIWLTSALIAFISAYDLHLYKTKALKLSANICILTFVVHGLFSASKVAFLLGGGEILTFTTQSFLNISSYFNLLIVSIFWTFAMIMMINQKLMWEKEKAKDYFEAIFNTSPDAILITNQNNSKITTVNDNFIEISGYKTEELLGKTTLELNFWINPEERQFFSEQIEKFGYCLDFESVFQLKDHQKIIGLLSSKVVKLEDKSYLINIVKDITSQKRGEQEILDKNLQLQTLNSEKDKFFSIIAHDLRNPISTFLGLTEIIAEDLSQLTKNETDQVAQKMKDSARNLYGLLENLLEWSMINQGLSRFYPYQFALYPEIFECIMNYSNTALKKNITIINSVSADEMVYSDQNMLRSLIRNLLSNALKFTPEGGTISIASKTTPDKYTLISIKDSGIGMNENIKNSLF
jgi:PAS domain S-box-containing protein